MNSGKSTALLQVAHNYEERGQAVVLLKPDTDTKGGSRVVSRLGVSRDVDILLAPDQDLRAAVAGHCAGIGPGEPTMACVLIDEAQFLAPTQVDQALATAVLDG